MNSSGKYQDKETIAIWNNLSEQYDPTNYWEGYDNQANLKILLSHIGQPRKKRIIEVGCGSGLISLALGKLGAECAILDISSVALKGAIDGFLKSGLSEPECYNEDALSNSVPSNSFDVTWNGGVIEHFYDNGKELLLKEMYRMTKPGGKVIILVPNAWCLPFKIVQIWKKFRKDWAYGYEDDMSPRRLRKMCIRLGLTNIEAYAFNTVVGWAWIPRIGFSIMQRFGRNTLECHCRHSRMGFVSVLVIKK